MECPSIIIQNPLHIAVLYEASACPPWLSYHRSNWAQAARHGYRVASLNGIQGPQQDDGSGAHPGAGKPGLGSSWPYEGENISAGS